MTQSTHLLCAIRSNKNYDNNWSKNILYWIFLYIIIFYNIIFKIIFLLYFRPCYSHVFFKVTHRWVSSSEDALFPKRQEYECNLGARATSRRRLCNSLHYHFAEAYRHMSSYGLLLENKRIQNIEFYRNPKHCLFEHAFIYVLNWAVTNLKKFWWSEKNIIFEIQEMSQGPLE